MVWQLYDRNCMLEKQWDILHKLRSKMLKLAPIESLDRPCCYICICELSNNMWHMIGWTILYIYTYLYIYIYTYWYDEGGKSRTNHLGMVYTNYSLVKCGDGLLLLYRHYTNSWLFINCFMNGIYIYIYSLYTITVLINIIPIWDGLLLITSFFEITNNRNDEIITYIHYHTL